MTDYLSPTLLDHFSTGLGARDQLVLESIGKLGWMLSSQVARLHFVDNEGLVQDRRCRDVLSRLCKQGWLYRYPHRRVGAMYGGSGQYAYALDLAGRRFLSGADDRARRQRKQDDPPAVGHVLAVAEVYVALIEQKRQGQLHAVGFLREFTGLIGVRPDGLLGLVPASADLDGTRRWFLEVELSRKDATRLDEKLDAYVNAWRTAGTQHGWSRFPRVLYAIGTLSRFPSDAMLLFREVEAAIRRQPADARPLFALARYEEAVPVLVGRQEPVTVPADEAPPAASAMIDPVRLVLPQHGAQADLEERNSIGSN